MSHPDTRTEHKQRQNKPFWRRSRRSEFPCSSHLGHLSNNEGSLSRVTKLIRQLLSPNFLKFVSKRFIPIQSLNPGLLHQLLGSDNKGWQESHWVKNGCCTPKHISFGVLKFLGWWRVMEEKLIIGCHPCHPQGLSHRYFIDLGCSISFRNVFQYLTTEVRNPLSNVEVCFVTKVCQLLAHVSRFRYALSRWH